MLVHPLHNFVLAFVERWHLRRMSCLLWPVSSLFSIFVLLVIPFL